MLGALALLATAACVAAPVHAGVVRAGPFSGVVAAPYDVLGGRFRLHVGPYRDARHRLTQTITWTVPRRYRVGTQLTITFRRISPAPHSLVAQYAPKSAAGAKRRWTFPSILQPTAAGCWRMTLRSGPTSGSLTVLVRG